MAKELDNNWALVHKNLTVLIESIKSYYDKVLDLHQIPEIDIMEISQNKNNN